eukprot:Skav214161  [mRNA]  locus=scaffold945:144431:144727:- [translate_table: standard]
MLVVAVFAGGETLAVSTTSGKAWQQQDHRHFIRDLDNVWPSMKAVRSLECLGHVTKLRHFRKRLGFNGDNEPLLMALQPGGRSTNKKLRADGIATAIE